MTLNPHYMHRHLDYPAGTPMNDLGPAALDDLVERGDLDDWKPVAAAIAGDPWGSLAERLLDVVGANPRYGRTRLWVRYVERRRLAALPAGPALTLAGLRRKHRLGQAHVANRLGISQSDVSKLEHRDDVRLSTLAAYLRALDGRLRLVATFADGSPPVMLQHPALDVRTQEP